MKKFYLVCACLSFFLCASAHAGMYHRCSMSSYADDGVTFRTDLDSHKQIVGWTHAGDPEWASDARQYAQCISEFLKIEIQGLKNFSDFIQGLRQVHERIVKEADGNGDERAYVNSQYQQIRPINHPLFSLSCKVRSDANRSEAAAYNRCFDDYQRQLKNRWEETKNDIEETIAEANKRLQTRSGKPERQQPVQMPEYHVRHILLKDKDSALAMIRKLNAGADFAKLARENSTDASSAKNGGDIGWSLADQLVAPFAQAMVNLQKHQYSKEPVQTEFGWHVLLLEDVR